MTPLQPPPGRREATDCECLEWLGGSRIGFTLPPGADFSIQVEEASALPLRVFADSDEFEIAVADQGARLS